MPFSDPNWGSERRLLRSTYRTLAAIEFLLAVHALVVNVIRLKHAVHPVWVIVASLVMIAWSALAWRLEAQRGDSQTVMLVGHMLIAIGLIIASPWILGEADGVSATLAVSVYWHMTVPLAIAVRLGVTYGVIASIGLGGLLIVTTSSLRPRVWSETLGMIALAWGVGQVVTQLRTTIAQRDATFARAAVLAERDRMARIVHDGALQVLSLVEREGPALGPRGVRLARLARTQEVQLRAALQDRSVPIVGEVVPDATEDVDIAPMLEAHESATVTVSLMAGQLMMPQWQAIEIEAAVRQVLQNVRRHAGTDAQAWVLGEETDDAVLISIRDNGVGMTDDQVAAALSSDRMGMRQSIIGRMESIGGTATVSSRSGHGLEWELRLPR